MGIGIPTQTDAVCRSSCEETFATKLDLNCLEVIHAEKKIQRSVEATMDQNAYLEEVWVVVLPLLHKSLTHRQDDCGDTSH